MSNRKKPLRADEEIKEREETEETAGAEEMVEEEEVECEAPLEGETQCREDEQNDKYLRLLADFQNYRKRSEKEKADIYAYANEKILTELLDVADNFERALAHEADASGGYVEGMNMIFRNFMGVLEKAGIEEIEALGAEFDPNFHSAVMTEAGSGYDSGTVCGVIQKGYKLNNRVIRPSMVRVAE